MCQQFKLRYKYDQLQCTTLTGQNANNKILRRIHTIFTVITSLKVDGAYSTH